MYLKNYPSETVLSNVRHVISTISVFVSESPTRLPDHMQRSNLVP